MGLQVNRSPEATSRGFVFLGPSSRAFACSHSLLERAKERWGGPQRSDNGCRRRTARPGSGRSGLAHQRSTRRSLPARRPKPSGRRSMIDFAATSCTASCFQRSRTSPSTCRTRMCWSS